METWLRIERFIYFAPPLFVENDPVACCVLRGSCVLGAEEYPDKPEWSYLQYDNGYEIVTIRVHASIENVIKSLEHVRS